MATSDGAYAVIDVATKERLTTRTFATHEAATAWLREQGWEYRISLYHKGDQRAWPIPMRHTRRRPAMIEAYVWLCARGHQCAVSETEIRLAIVEPRCGYWMTEGVTTGTCGARLIHKLYALSSTEESEDAS